MYSGTTLTPLSGRILGAHQKIDRLARAALRRNNPDLFAHFPTAKDILRFEGMNGPDAIKRKSPARDEPWHYYAPFDPKDTELLDIIDGHHNKLVASLREQDMVRAAFEAAWLAHAIVDGLTPAHHYPYEEELTELRGGHGKESRTTIRKKLVMPGENRREQIRNNWKMWGPKGLLTTHGMFEWGIAAIIAPLTVKGSRVELVQADFDELQQHGIEGLFKRKAKEVAALGMYDDYYQHGWTPKLARQVRRSLVPIIVQCVALAWYSAAAAAKQKA